jgi:hypothetical protein
MLLQYYYWWQKDVLPLRFIDHIFKTVKIKQYEEALTFGARKRLKDLRHQKKTKRDTKVIWLNDVWMYQAINPIVESANQSANWNFEWNYNEQIQFGRYDKNKFYGWHSDSLEHPWVYDRPNQPHFHNKMRKLSTIISLNDASEYEGGEVLFDFRNSDIEKSDSVSNIVVCEELKTKGTVVTFPSHVWHKVSPVTKGVRYSLVLWHLGWPFK